MRLVNGVMNNNMSAKKLNIGDYVRTKHYGICRVTDIYIKELIELDKINAFGIKGISYSIENIIKSSPNIMDLIEVGDIYKKTYPTGLVEIIPINKFEDLYSIKNDIKNGFKISIVTKEQFESMEYKIESEVYL